MHCICGEDTCMQLIILKKSPGLKIDLIHLGVSRRQQENIWSTNQNCKVPVWPQSSMVVISEENTGTLVNGAPYLFVSWRPCKIRERIGETSVHCPYNLSLFISFTSSPYCELWYSMCRSISSTSYLRMMLLFSFFYIYLYVRLYVILVFFWPFLHTLYIRSFAWC